MSKLINLWISDSKAYARASEIFEDAPFVRPCVLSPDFYDASSEDGADEINIIVLPTNMQIALVSKGRMELDLTCSASHEDVLSALWPRHAIYSTGPDAADFLKETFLPGMTSFVCQPFENGVKVTAETIPGDTAASITDYIKRSLDSAGLKAEMTAQAEVLAEPFRSKLEPDVIKALTDTSIELTGRGPVFEWFQRESPVRELSSKRSNVFILGDGALDGMWRCGSSQEAGALLSEKFRSYVLSLYEHWKKDSADDKI